MTTIKIDQHEVHLGSCLDVLPTIGTATIDAIVTDPPYGLSNVKPDGIINAIKEWASGNREFVPDAKGFMGKDWDAFVPPPAVWDECFRVLKPGGHLLAFAGTRTQDLMGLAVRLAGFEIRDSIAWMYGSGFPKSLDVAKAIDKAAGAERETKKWVRTGKTVSATNSVGTRGGMTGNLQCPDCGKWKFSPDYCRCPKDNGAQTDTAKKWEGWGTALKPAHEPIIVARKPLVGTVAENVNTYGTGAINIAATRIAFRSEEDRASATPQGRVTSNASAGAAPDVDAGERREIDRPDNSAGRFPANVMLDETMAAILDEQSGTTKSPKAYVGDGYADSSMFGVGGVNHANEYGDTGGASRFFYVAKASKRDRNEGLDERANIHPTVKPTDLMRQLVRLVTPPDGVVLDPFTGSGSTGKAAILEDFTFVGIELTEEYIPIIEGRLRHAAAQQPEATLF